MRNVLLNFLAVLIGLALTVVIFVAVDKSLKTSRTEIIRKTLAPESSEDAFFKTFETEVVQSIKVTPVKDKIISEVKIIRKNDGHVLNQAHYVTDQFYRRLPHAEINSNTAIVYIGCSFVFGENLNNEETLPVFAEKLFPKIRHINLGLPNLGLNDIYAQIYIPGYRTAQWKNFDPLERYLNLPVKKIILVYYFIGDHLFRAQCSQRCHDEDEKVVRSKPFFEVEDNKLVFKGNHENYLNTFSELLSSSNILRRQGIEIPNPFSESDIQRHFLFLQKIKEAYSEKFEVVDAYTFYNPLEEESIINKVEQQNKNMDFKPIILDKNFLVKTYGISNLLIPYDGHPSPQMNKISAEEIIERIQKDHPALAF